MNICLSEATLQNIDLSIKYADLTTGTFITKPPFPIYISNEICYVISSL